MKVRRLMGIVLVTSSWSQIALAGAGGGEGGAQPAPTATYLSGTQLGMISIDISRVTKEIEPASDVPKNFEMAGLGYGPKLTGIFHLNRLVSLTASGVARKTSLTGTLAKTSKNPKPIELSVETLSLGGEAGVGFALSERAGFYVYGGYEGLLTGKGELKEDDTFDSDLGSFTDRRLGLRLFYELWPRAQFGMSTGYSSGQLKWRKLSKRVDHEGFDTSVVFGYSFQ